MRSSAHGNDRRRSSFCERTFFRILPRVVSRKTPRRSFRLCANVQASAPVMVSSEASSGLAASAPGALTSGKDFCRDSGITMLDDSHLARAALGRFYRSDSRRWAPRGLLDRALPTGFRHRVLPERVGESVPRGMLLPAMAQSRKQDHPSCSAAPPSFAASESVSDFRKNNLPTSELLLGAVIEPQRRPKAERHAQ